MREDTIQISCGNSSDIHDDTRNTKEVDKKAERKLNYSIILRSKLSSVVEGNS